MRTYLVRIPRRKGHSIQRDVPPGLGHCWPRPTHPRSDSSWPQREGSQAALGRLGSNNRAESCSLLTPLCPDRLDGPRLATTIPPTWAEGRALLGSNPSAVPGANTEWGGTMPPSSFGIGTKALNPPGPLPGGVPRYPLIHTTAPAFLSSLPRRGPGTRRR